MPKAYTKMQRLRREAEKLETDVLVGIMRAEFEAHKINDEIDRRVEEILRNQEAAEAAAPPAEASEEAGEVDLLNLEPNLGGFAEHSKGLVIKRKEGGFARLGDVMRPNQRDFFKNVAAYREAKRPIQWIELKCRQWVTMSTNVAAVLASDTMLNAGFDSIVTAQDDDSLDKISTIYRNMFGRTRREGRKQGKAERMGDRLFSSPLGSSISLQVADADLARSGSGTGLHVSEAGYIQNWNDAQDSMEPFLTDKWWRFWILETTLRRNNPGEFRDFIDGVMEKQFPPWEVHFTAWHANPDLVDYGEGLAEFCEHPPDYERMLVENLGLKWSQAHWYFTKRLSLRGSYEAMQEAYPSTLEEALFLGKGAAFFSADAIRWYTQHLQEPVQRLKMTSSGLRPFELGDSPLNPHVEVYEAPVFGAKYRGGADCADADERIAVEGSENACVIVNEDTGRMVAVYHGQSSANEFADVLHALGQRYNETDLTVEWNNAGRAVINRLREHHNYTHLYQRETFKYGVSQGVVPGAYGFDTRGHTRGILLDRLQLGVSNRLWTIPSKYVLDAVKVLGKRNGVKARQTSGDSPDDGAVALALTGIGHDRLTSKAWLPKDIGALEVIEAAQEKPPARRGIRIMNDRKKLSLDSWGMAH